MKKGTIFMGVSLAISLTVSGCGMVCDVAGILADKLQLNSGESADLNNSLRIAYKEVHTTYDGSKTFANPENDYSKGELFEGKYAVLMMDEEAAHPAVQGDVVFDLFHQVHTILQQVLPAGVPGDLREIVIIIADLAGKALDLGQCFFDISDLQPKGVLFPVPLHPVAAQDNTDIQRKQQYHDHCHRDTEQAYECRAGYLSFFHHCLLLSL